MGIKDIYVKPADDRRPSRLWERLHPRQAEAYWAAEEEREELRIEAFVREDEQDRAYDRYVTRCHDGVQKGNPPDSRALDRQMEKFSDWYPEITELEEQKAAYEDGELELDLDAYEPFPWLDEWRRDHSEYEREFYWEDAHPELCTHDQLRVAHAAWLKTPQGQREQQERYGWFGEPWPDQAEQAIDEGRFVPTEYDLGITNEPQDELGQQDPGNWDPPWDPRDDAHGGGRGEKKEEPQEDYGNPLADYFERSSDPIDFGPARYRSKEPEPPGLLRIIPMEKSAGIAWEYPGEREVRGEREFNPYDNWPRYTQWWQPQPDAEP
jgi:hypothetical protein